MRKSQTQKIDEVISECLRDLDIEKKLKEVRVTSGWEQLMGITVARRTSQVYIRNRILYVHLTSSVLKNELLMMRRHIVDKINEYAGQTIIDEIVFR